MAATDGYRVFVDLDFFGSLSEADARFVLAHEYLHVILGHGDRRRDRTRRTWNLATDFAVNQTLVEFGFEVPQGGLFDKRFRGETAEAIYDALLETRVPEMPHLAGMAGHGGMAGQGDIEGRGDPGEPSAGRGDMAVTPAGAPGDAHARLQDALTDGQRARLLAPGGWDLQLDPSDSEGANTTEGGSLTALERRRLRQSLASAMKSRAHGRAAGYLADEIAAAAEPYVSWEALLAQFVGGIRRSRCVDLLDRWLRAVPDSRADVPCALGPLSRWRRRTCGAVRLHCPHAATGDEVAGPTRDDLWRALEPTWVGSRHGSAGRASARAAPR